MIYYLRLLKKNINSKNKKELINNSILFKKNFSLKKRLKLDNFEFINYCYVSETFSKYYKACDFKLKKIVN